MDRKEFTAAYNIGYRDGKLEEYDPNGYQDFIEQQPCEDEELDFVQPHKKIEVDLVKFDTPYTDVISRQAAIDAMREDTCWSCWDAKYILEHLPSVSTETPNRCDNAISREDVLDEINRIGVKAFETYNDYSELFDFVDSLPSVNPQANNEDINREREQAYMCGYEEGSRKYRTEQSEDAISRQAAIDAILENCIDGDPEMQKAYDIMGIDDCIKALPTVTVQEKTGRWKRISMDLYTQHATAYYKCSKCGNNNIGASNYCPNCGAKMLPQPYVPDTNDGKKGESEDKE